MRRKSVRNSSASTEGGGGGEGGGALCAREGTLLRPVGRPQ